LAEGVALPLNRRQITMQITRSSLETVRGPADRFTGDVYIDTIASRSGPSGLGAAVVHFTRGARTTWHTHPHGQTIWVTEGVGICQREGGPVEVIRAGDRVFFEALSVRRCGPPLSHRGRQARLPKSGLVEL
jgi:quercetin dioxygenase-like cupin family protein